MLILSIQDTEVKGKVSVLEKQWVLSTLAIVLAFFVFSWIL